MSRKARVLGRRILLACYSDERPGRPDFAAKPTWVARCLAQPEERPSIRKVYGKKNCWYRGRRMCWARSRRQFATA